MKTIENTKKYCFNEINEVFCDLTKKKRKNREKEIIIGGKIAVKQIISMQETVDVFSS